MGPYKAKRAAVAQNDRWNNISVMDDKQEAVTRAHFAWQDVSAHCIVSGWRQVCPVFSEEQLMGALSIASTDD